MINVDSGLDKERRGGSGFAIDIPFLASAVFLIVLGLMTVFSVSKSVPELGIFKKQLMFMVVGIIPMLMFSLTPVGLWPRISNWLYLVNVFLLAAVLKMGKTGGGAQRWIDIGPMQFQPSEMTKIVCVITLAVFFESRKDRVKEFSTFVLSFLHILPSLMLVILQPHMGAALTIIVTWASICIIARVPWKYLFMFFAIIITLFSVLLNAPPNPIIRPYHKKRLYELFQKNEKNENDAGYQQARGEIAFGLGGVTGEGYGKGDFKSSKGVPKQHTDFIMTVVGEEGGFMGSLVLLAGYLFFFLRGWSLAIRMSDGFSQMCAFGVLTVLAFHMFVNVQMNLAIGPVIGLWLPFMSYGGTAMWLCMSCVGLILSLNAQRRKGMFSSNPWSDVE